MIRYLNLQIFVELAKIKRSYYGSFIYLALLFGDKRKIIKPCLLSSISHTRLVVNIGPVPCEIKFIAVKPLWCDCLAILDK